MYIIGLHNDEDAGVCLLKDGEILDAISEERLTRKKLFKGLPQLSLAHVFNRHGLTYEDIDYFAYGWYGKQNDYPGYITKLLDRTMTAHSANAGVAEIQARVNTEFERDGETRSEFEEWMRAKGVGDDRVVFLDHHASHAWSAFAASPFDEAFVFTFDGRGDLKSATASLASTEGGVTEYDYQLSFDSLGFLYGQITHYLGFLPHRHEGKVTGLAAYGTPSKTLPLFQSLIDWQDGKIIANLNLFRPYYTNLSSDLLALLDSFSKEDIAAGLQKHCEQLVEKFVAHWMAVVDRPHVRNVCLAGGLFANVKVNQRVLALPGVENVFVFPAMGDGGLPAGAAFHLNYKLTGKAKVDLPSVYLGPQYTDTEIKACIAEFGEQIHCEDLGNRKVDDIVEALVNDQVVGYFDGRMEYGPRALGARSILHHSRDVKANDWLNERLGRTEFMPFAPVTPVEFADECYVGWQKSHRAADFMTITYDCHRAFTETHPAVVHVDGTARPQVVNEQCNGDYYAVVKKYCDLTGERALINTSFNHHEEPIVCSPTDAVRSLLDNNVDVLYVGGHKISRTSGVI